MMSNEMDHIDPNIHSSIDTSVSWFLSFYFVNSYEKKRKYLFLWDCIAMCLCLCVVLEISKVFSMLFFEARGCLWISGQIMFWVAMTTGKISFSEYRVTDRRGMNFQASQSLNSRDPGWCHIGFRQSLWTSNPVRSPKFSHVERFYPSRILAT